MPASVFPSSEMNKPGATDIVIPWLLLVGFGLVMVSSASAALPDSYLPKHLLYLLLSFVAWLDVRQIAIPPFGSF